ncbi:hypothetical protein QF000_007951 [Paraburkholderia atlantica]|uniref:hypothetical protein n=1 Tax=Paraburkholderia TaxID=1822464 RepID=UPI003D1C6E68
MARIYATTPSECGRDRDRLIDSNCSRGRIETDTASTHGSQHFENFFDSCTIVQARASFAMTLMAVSYNLSGRIH